MNELTTTAAQRTTFDLSPQTFDQALTFSQYLADSDLVPKDFKGRQGNCLIAMQWGAELGLKPLQALQNLAIINGRPALWGDAVIALVRASSVCEYVIETQTDTVATCKVKRRGEPEQERTFSMADAQAAGLKGKSGPWTQYPKRMLQMRARSFALRDVFPDVLRGMQVAEELMDYQQPAEKNMGAADVVQQPAEPQAPPTWPAKAFAAQFPRWKKAVEAGLKTADDIEALATSKGTLTAEQLAAIRALRAAPPTEAAPAPAAADDDFVSAMEAAEGAEGGAA